MKKSVLLLLLPLFVLITHAGETVSQVAFTALWPFDVNDAAMQPTLSHPSLVGVSYFSMGSDLAFSGTAKGNDATYTQSKVKSTVSTSGPAESNALKFMFKPKTGLTFTPTRVSFTATRYGTDGGNFDAVWLSADGTKTTLVSKAKPERNNAGSANHSDYAFTLSGSAEQGECGLIIYQYSLSNKEYGYDHILIEGIMDGTVADVTTYSLAVSTSPADAGTVDVKPVGTTFDAGTEVTVSQTRHFGYRFTGWTDADGTVVSTDDTYSFAIGRDETLTASYEAVATYALEIVPTNGAKSYMVSLDPAPTVINGKNMYEEGTRVTLSASNNPILTFASWNGNETSGSTQVTMDADRTVTANYNATDYIVGWDFHEPGNNGRPADFAAAGNDADALLLRNAAGNTAGWLDKSTAAAGGYEGKPAAVNWRPLADRYYYQTKINAEAFTDIRVQSEMLYNYNAYQTQVLEYSLDGNSWQEVARVTITGNKKWTSLGGMLPAACDNQQEIYLRWIPDYTSPIDGTSSDNDGTAITAIYVTGKAKPVDDGRAPTLLSSVPADGATGASTAGMIVLNFSEKVLLADDARATLNGQPLTGSAVSQTVSFPYKGLEYGQDYTFTLAAGSVHDLMGNVCTDAITLHFTTKTRPAVAKGGFDFIVPDDGTFSDAIVAANSRTDKSARYRIFVRQGDYLVAGDKGATITGNSGASYPSPSTTVTASNISIIGEGMDNTQLRNACSNWADIESLHRAHFIYLSSGVSNTYVQDITFRSGHKLGDGRCPALEDYGTRSVFKNFRMWGTQDTYYSRNGRYYFESSALHGSVDFLCGGGDAVFNDCDLVIERDGSVLCAPASALKYGYVFLNCTVRSADAAKYKSYTLGRPWGSGTPGAIFIGTTMEVVADAVGWSEMSGGYPMRFAEYGTRTKSGTLIDLSQRKTTFGEGHANNPILTADEAAGYTVARVLGGDDDWDPQSLTEQAPNPTGMTIADGVLTWDDNDYVLCWAVCKDGKVIDFTREPSYTLDDTEASWGLRAVNEMGGLGELVPAAANAIRSPRAEAADSHCYDLLGRVVSLPLSGSIYVSNGKKVVF